jgi:hypothetical protein
MKLRDEGGGLTVPGTALALTEVAVTGSLILAYDALGWVGGKIAEAAKTLTPPDGSVRTEEAAIGHLAMLLPLVSVAASKRLPKPLRVGAGIASIPIATNLGLIVAEEVAVANQAQQAGGVPERATAVRDKVL